MSRNTRPRFAALFISAAFVVSPAVADGVLDEIVVTADFRERRAAELSPSVKVLDATAIEERAVQHFEELIASVPNLNWSGDGHRARYFQIRGVGELEQYEGAPNPSVGFLIDDIDFSGIGTIATLFDIEQIEVLRGPQGTRYGANALAGLIYVRSREPSTEWNSRLQVQAGGDGALGAGFALGGPLAGEDLAFRASAQHYAADGFRYNAFLDEDDSNRRQETTLRGKLRWETNNDWIVTLAGLYADIDDGYDAFAIDNSLTMRSDKPGRDAQESVGASLRADWDGSERTTFTSITSVADSTIDFSFDADWGNDDFWAPFTYDFTTVSDRERRTASQELRLASGPAGRLFGDSVDWLAGVYVQRLEDLVTTHNEGVYVDPGSGFTLSIDDRLASDFEALSTALFGQLDIDVGEAGLLTFGLRGERRTTDYTDSAGLALDPAESMLGGELKYRHVFADGLAAFVGLSKGYKAGGFNLGMVPEGRREFSQEGLWNLELGVRTAWLGDTLLLNAVAFLSEHRDQQVRTSFQLVPNDPASFVFFTDNAASGRTLGLESELRYRSGERWEWYASIGLLDAEFDDFTTPQVDLSGRDQAHAPGYTLAAGGIWRHPSGLYARVDVSAKDAFYFDVSHDQRSSAYELANVRVGFEGDRWSVEGWGRNVFDERYAVRGFYFGNEPPNFPNELYIRQGDPRQFGVTFDLYF